MNRRALAFLVIATVAACAKSEDSASLADTAPMPPVDGSIPLVSSGTAPAQTIAAPQPGDYGAIAAGEDTGSAAPRPRDDTLRPRAIGSPRDPDRPDSIIGRDSAITGPFIPVPVPPDTG